MRHDHEGRRPRREAFHSTPLAASLVRPPLVAECYANLECKIVDARLASKFDLFVLEVVKDWADPPEKTRKRFTTAASANLSSMEKV
jgi:flavin reductase (DIM6/NTAB) family NADH-FMN oxidoreductase RutF